MSEVFWRKIKAVEARLDRIEARLNVDPPSGRSEETGSAPDRDELSHTGGRQTPDSGVGFHCAIPGRTRLMIDKAAAKRRANEVASAVETVEGAVVNGLYRKAAWRARLLLQTVDIAESASASVNAILEMVDEAIAMEAILEAKRHD